MAVASVQLNFRIPVETSDKLEALVKTLGTTKTAVVEQAINRLYEETQGDK